jgi:hypothetical protein
MSAQAADFVPVVPYQQTVVDIAIGKISTMFLLTQKGNGTTSFLRPSRASGIIGFRAVPESGCGANLNSGIHAIVQYDGADMSLEPTSSSYIPTTIECVDEVGLKPVVARNVGNLISEEEFDDQ